MDKNTLKIVAGEMIVENDGLTNQAKLQLLKFVEKDASEEQIMALLLDGKIQALDEQAEQIVRDRFALSELETKTKTVLKWGLAGLVYRQFMSKAAKACKGQENKEACMQSYTIKALNAKINAVKKAMADCDKTKNPKKCKIKGIKMIEKAKVQLKNAQTQLQAQKAKGRG